MRIITTTISEIPMIRGVRVLASWKMAEEALIVEEVNGKETSMMMDREEMMVKGHHQVGNLFHLSLEVGLEEEHQQGNLSLLKN